MLLALHLTLHKKMLADFLGALEIPQQQGLIESQEPIDPPDPARLRAAVTRLSQIYSPADVKLYLASLRAMDPGVWGGLAEIDPPCA